MTYTVGSYLARRLRQIGLKHHFAVAGDFNLVLLDQLLTVKELEQVCCCNELNCGYSAEGYARACGAAAAVVTFSVGGLSAINAIGGAYAENLPVILVSGAPNSNDRATEHLIHHTLATHDWSYQFEIAKKLTCAAVSITSATEAPHQIDHAIRNALREKKPAYIEIACNVASAPCAAPGPISAILGEEPSDPETLRAAIAAAAEFLQAKQKPILLIGSKLRAAGAEKQVIELAEALGCAVTVMAAAKSFFPEDHPQFAGVYWGEVSAPGAREIFDWADSAVCIGTIFNDYSTVGWTAMPSGEGVLTADQQRVYLEGHDFGRIHLRDFLSGLASKVEKAPGHNGRVSAHPPSAAAPTTRQARSEADAHRNLPPGSGSRYRRCHSDRRDRRLLVQRHGSETARRGALRDRDAVGLRRMGRAGRIRLRRWRVEPAHYRLDRGRVISADRARSFADDSAEAAGYHLPYQQSRLHDRS